MRRRLLIFVTLAVLAAAATFAAVSGASFTTASSTAVRAATAPLSGDTLRADSGDGQVATAGAAVATAPSVKVTDAGGNPVSGVSVTFAVASGGGSVTGASAVTDASGVAAAGSWTLGATAGVNTLTAAATGISGSVTFTATGTAGDARTITINAGDEQSATVNTTVATDPAVLVIDAGGNPVSGVSVSFAVASGGGSATGLTATTDESGVATVGSWKLGTLAGANTLTASSSGLTSATFTATGTAGAATKYGVTAPQYYVRTSTAVTISAQLQDTYGNAVGTPTPVSVSWTRSTAISSYGTLQTTTSTTNPSGVATVQFTASSTAGRTNTVIARSTSATSVTGTSPTITAVGAASRIAAYAGTGQTATVGTAVANPPSVKVTDSGSRPVPGTTVTFAVASGGGSATGLTATTDGNGIAAVGSWTLGTTAGSNTLRATSGSLSGSPVTFTATGAAGAATQLAVETAADGSGSAITTRSVSAGAVLSVYAVTRDAYGNFVANAAAIWSLSGSTGGVVSDDLVAAGDGRSAVFNGHLAGTTSVQAASDGLSGGTGTVTVVKGSASRIVATAGDEQSATVNTAVATDPTALVIDAGGNPVSGVSVTFAVASGGGSATGLTATTDGNGVAAVGSWKLGTTAGANTLTASSSGLTSATFTATGTAGAATQLAVETAADGSGSAIASRSLTAGASLAGYAVTRDAYGNFVDNAAATWSLSGSTGGVAGDDLVAAGDGKSAVFTGHLVGTTAMRAVAGALSDSTGTVTVTADVPATVVVTSSNYNPTASSSVTINALVLDRWGNPVKSTSVTFAKDTGSSTGGSFSSTLATTNNSGVASTTFNTSTTRGRTYYIKATASGVSDTTDAIITR